MRKQLYISGLFALIYILLGSLEVQFDLGLSRYIDGIRDGLDLYLVFPSHASGTWLCFILGGNDLYFWIGQLVGLVLFWLAFYQVGSVLKSLSRSRG